MKLTPDSTDKGPPAKFVRPVPATPPDEPSFLWVKIIGTIVLMAVAGGAFYQFYWKYRLPQEHIFTDNQGNKIEARIEARGGEAVKYTRLSDGSVRLISTSTLSDEDQALVHGLKSTMPLTMPLTANISDRKGNNYSGEIIGRNTKYVKINQLPESTVSYIAFDDLSENDAAWLRLLPNNLTFSFPVKTTLNFPDGRVLEARLEGRSDRLVRVYLVGDGSMHVYPMDRLSAENQAFIRNLPITQTLAYPVELALTNADGTNVEAVLLGRSSTTVRYSLPGDRRPHTVPFTTFNNKTQDYLRTFPANIQDTFSMDRTLTMEKGDTIDVQLLGRTEDILKFILKSSGNVYYYPIVMLSADDQQYVKQLSPGLQIDYPIEYTLTDPNTNQPLPIRINALSSTNLRYLVLSNGRSFDSPFTAFSPIDQAVLRMLPPGAAPATAAERAQNTPAPTPTVAQTPKQIVVEVLTALKNSGVYGGELGMQRLRAGDPPAKVRTATAWTWMLRVSGRAEFTREDYQFFVSDAGLQQYIRNNLSSGIEKLQKVRTQANASVVDNLITDAKRALDGMDAMNRTPNTMNRTATAQIGDFIRRWDVAQ